MEQFSIIVGNVGTVLETSNEEEARKRFQDERTRSRFQEGARSFLECVSLHKGEEVLAEWIPPQDEDGESSERLWADEDGNATPSVLDFLADHCGGDVFEVERYGDSEECEDGGSLSYGSLEAIPGEWKLSEALAEGRLLVYVPPASSGSDYNGGALARANVRALETLADEENIVHWILSGGHGTHGIAFPLWERSASLLEALEGLDGYPVVDEETLGEVEREDEEEAWESWIRSDYGSALEKETGVDVSDVSDEDMREHFYSACESAGTYVEHGEETWIDVEALADGADRAELLALAGAVSDTADEEERARTILRTLREHSDRASGEGEDTLSESFQGDGRPVLEAWESAVSEVEALRVLDMESDPGSSLVSVLREVADYPLPDSETPLPEDLEKLRAECARYRKDLRIIRDGARGAVLPVLPAREERESPYDRTGRAEAWERSPESGLPVLEHFRRETEREWTEYVRSKDPKRNKRRTILLPREVEDRLSDALRDGVEGRELLRGYVLERIALECERRKGDGAGSGVLTSSAGGWSTVLEVDRKGKRVRIQDRREGREPEWRALQDFEYMVSRSF